VFRWQSLGTIGVALSGADVVRDFSHSAHDRLDLARLDANSLLSGNQAFAFIGRSEFTRAGEVRYEIVGTEARVLINTDADPEAEGLIRLANVQGLAARDFLL
jgi:hypothetical protein